MIEFNQILFTQGADEIIPNKGAWSLIVFVGELLLATSVYVFKLRRRNHFWLWLLYLILLHRFLWIDRIFDGLLQSQYPGGNVFRNSWIRNAAFHL